MNTVAKNIIRRGNTFAGLAPIGLDNFLLAQACTPTHVANPSYANSGGTGDRRSIITATATIPISGTGLASRFVSGDLTGNDTWWGSTSVGTNYFRFDFGSGASKVVNEAKYYQQNTTNQATLKWQGSNDASSWTDIGTSFLLGGVATQTITTLSANVTGYRYYQLVGVSGSMNGGPFAYQFEFKIDDA